MDENVDNLLMKYCEDLGLEKVNWFNFNEILNELISEYGLVYDGSNKLEKAFDSLFVKTCKELGKDVNSIKDVNIVAEYILNKIIDEYGDNISKNELENLTFPIDTVSKNHVTKSLNYFEAHKIIKRDPEGKPVFYRLSPHHWFEQSRYAINDFNVIKTIVPIIISYIKTGGVHNYNIQKLFEKISEVIEYVIKPVLYHNENNELEQEIIDLIDNNQQEDIPQSIDVYDSQRKGEFTLIPIRIKFEQNEKIIVANIVDENDNLISKNEEFSLEHISFLEYDTTDYSTETTSFPNTKYKTFTTYEEQEIKPKKEKFVDVVLECSTTLFEYFQIQPLKNMKVYATQEELEEFHQTIEYKPKNNKLYIVASDTEDMILSTVLHCLPEARILKPFELNDKLIQKFKDYGEDFIDICPPKIPTEPSSNSNEKSKKEDRNQSLKSSNNSAPNEKENKEMKDINDNIL